MQRAMPTGNAQYTLVGFCPELDWRPLRFVKPIPTNRLCSACGLVHKITALLPCMHVLCKSCYDLCDQDGLHACPLDGHEWKDEDDVEWREFPSEQLLKREVQCWNSEKGCQHVTPASIITYHFQWECLHHTTCCPKCSVSVLCSEVCAHLRSGTCGSLTDPLSEFQGHSNLKDEIAYFTTFREAFEKQAGENKGYLERMTADISMHGDRLNEFSHDLNTFQEARRQEQETGLPNPESLKETLRELATSTAEIRTQLTTQSVAVDRLYAGMNRIEKGLKDGFANVRTETAENISQITSALQEIKTKGKKTDQKTFESITTMLQFIRLQTTRCYFFVQGVKSLQEKALKQGSALYYNQRVYLRGYCISPGLHFVKEGDSVTVHVLLQLHKGDMDDVLPWTFPHAIKISIMHPKGPAEREAQVKPSSNEECYKRPTYSSNKEVYFTKKSFDLEDILKDGFVENDKLRVKWELLP